MDRVQAVAGHSTGQGARRAPRPPARPPCDNREARLVTSSLQWAGRSTSYTRASPPSPHLLPQEAGRVPGRLQGSSRQGERAFCKQEVPSGSPAEGCSSPRVIHTLGLYPQPPGLRKGAKGIRSSSLGPKCPTPPTNPGEDHPDSRLPEASGLPAPFLLTFPRPTHPPY